MADGERSYFDPLVLARLSSLSLKARWVVEGIMSGIHRSRSKGFSVEFEEHREYSPGDEIRRIDWKALGKFDRYFIKETEDETNLRATLILDGSASMDYGSNGVTKFEYASILTASLAYLILRQQDAAGVVTFSNRIESFIPPKAKRGYVFEILRALEAHRPGGGTDAGKILMEIAGKMTRRGLVILVSDLLDDAAGVLQALRLLRFNGHDVIVFHVMDSAEIELPFDGNILFEDMEQADLKVTADPQTIREVYRGVVDEFIESVKKECHASTIDYQLVSTATPLDRALVSYLSWRD
ncbi:MAG TPA: DUF58 domain-containing protein [Candidatus Binatia bacterium]